MREYNFFLLEHVTDAVHGLYVKNLIKLFTEDQLEKLKTKYNTPEVREELLRHLNKTLGAELTKAFTKKPQDGEEVVIANESPIMGSLMKLVQDTADDFNLKNVEELPNISAHDFISKIQTKMGDQDVKHLSFIGLMLYFLVIKQVDVINRILYHRDLIMPHRMMGQKAPLPKLKLPSDAHIEIGKAVNLDTAAQQLRAEIGKGKLPG